MIVKFLGINYENETIIIQTRDQKMSES